MTGHVRKKEVKLMELLTKIHEAKERGAQMISARCEALISEAYALGILDDGDTVTSIVTGDTTIVAKDGSVQLPKMRKFGNLSLIHHHRTKTDG